MSNLEITFWVISIIVSIIYLAINFIDFKDLKESVKSARFQEMGWWTIPYFLVPFFSLIYCFILLPIKQTPTYKMLFSFQFLKKGRREALKAIDDEVHVSSISSIVKNAFNANTGKIVNIPAAKLIYNFTNELAYPSPQEITLYGETAENILSQLVSTFDISESELKLLTLNSRMDYIHTMYGNISDRIEQIKSEPASKINMEKM